MIGRVVFAGLAAFVLAGCATVQPVQSGSATRQIVEDRNYTLGAQRTVQVGESVVRVRDYVVLRRPVAGLRATEDFRVRGGYDIAFTEGEMVRIGGTRLVDGRTLYVVPQAATQLGMAAYVNLQVDADGVVQNQILGPLNQTLIFGVTPEPSSARLQPVMREEIAAGEPYSNYELIFNGFDGQAMRLTYREYSPEDLARTAFFQDLSYPISARTLRFRALAIDVVSVGENGLTYIVRADR